MQFKIFRYDPGTKKKGYDEFELEVSKGMTVLDALFFIREHKDGSLSFRYACRGAVCGSCAMLINRVPRLACRTQVLALKDGKSGPALTDYPGLNTGETFDPTKEVLVEPLPNMKVLKDLIVDMTKFYDNYRALGPVLRPSTKAPQRERPMSPDNVTALDIYTRCILCGACVGACPVRAEKPEFLGPAALAKLYRFHIDPREKRDGSRLKTADHENGWWDCEFVGNCTAVCPKGVTPNQAIGKARAELISMRKGGPQGKSVVKKRMAKR